MKHLPFNHTWQVLGYNHPYRPDDRTLFSQYHHETDLDLLCSCGKVRTKTIARFQMDHEQINQYIQTVYND